MTEPARDLNTELLEASRLGHCLRIMELLDLGADIECKDGSGFSPLLKAVVAEHT